MTPTDLDQELADLRSVADAYAARHQFIPDLTWPEGVRIAVNFTCDFDAMLLRRLLNEPPMQLAKGEFGGRVGIWRLVELFDAQMHYAIDDAMYFNFNWLGSDPSAQRITDPEGPNDLRAG